MTEEGGIGHDALLVESGAHGTGAGVHARVAGSKGGNAFGAGETDDSVGIGIVITLLSALAWLVLPALIVVLSTLVLIATLLAGEVLPRLGDNLGNDHRVGESHGEKSGRNSKGVRSHKCVEFTD